MGSLAIEVKRGFHTLNSRPKIIFHTRKLDKLDIYFVILLKVLVGYLVSAYCM